MSGEAELAMGTEVDQAVIRFRDAMAIAKRQGAKSLELRGAISLARVEKEAGHGNGAQEALEHLLGGFGEGQSTFDVREARELLP